jgi:hypothetical protein
LQKVVRIILTLAIVNGGLFLALRPAEWPEIVCTLVGGLSTSGLLLRARARDRASTLNTAVAVFVGGLLGLLLLPDLLREPTSYSSHKDLYISILSGAIGAILFVFISNLVGAIPHPAKDAEDSPPE